MCESTWEHHALFCARSTGPRPESTGGSVEAAEELAAYFAMDCTDETER